MSRHPRISILILSLLIATIIFVTAVLSNFSVQMFTIASEQRAPFVGIGIGLSAILIITLIVWISFYMMPDLKKAMSRMFGIDDSDKRQDDDE